MTLKKDELRKKARELQKYESDMLKALSSLMRVTQREVMIIAREHADLVMTMYNDGYSAHVTALYIRGIHQQGPEEAWTFAREFAQKHSLGQKDKTNEKCA